MLQAARSLAREKAPDLGTEPAEIVAVWKTHFVDTQLFFDPFAGGKFAHSFLRIHEEKARAADAEAAHHIIEEAQLFVDASHQCYARLGATLGATGILTPAAPSAPAKV